MSALQVRLWGDPFGRGESSRALRGFLAAAEPRAVECGLCLTGAVGEQPGIGRAVPLTDGVRSYAAHTLVDDAELAAVQRAASRAVVATAPLIVFGDQDRLLTAALEFPEACLVHAGTPHDPERQIDELIGAVARVGFEHPLAPRDAAALEAFLDLGPADPDAPVLLLGDEGAEHAAAMLPPPWRGRWRDAAGPLMVEHLGGASAVVWPARGPVDLRLLQIMAAGRPLIVSRNRFTAGVLNEPGLCFPVGGRYRAGPTGSVRFEPDVRMVRRGLEIAFGDWRAALATAARARHHVQTHHVGPRPRRRRVRVRAGRPVVVLEAPLFETSSSATLTLETARALRARGRVAVQLVPRRPFRTTVRHLRRSAPELVPLLTRDPGPADLWLSAGWPPRAHRPEARCHAVRLDWEYGSLPAELLPLVSADADLVVVHSDAVRRVVADSGRDPASIAVVPHGVDGAVFNERAEPMAEVSRFKGRRPAVLFAGGLIWRKGIDLFLKAVAETARDTGLCVVVKPMGGNSSYFGSGLGDLVRRFAATAGAPELLVLDQELTRSQMAGLYRASDVLLHPYRGEGFGLPVLEAMACGLPVLVSRGGSTDDFCDTPASLSVPTRRVFVELPEVCVGRPFLLEPSGPDLVAGLARALRSLPALRRSAERDAPALRARHTWEQAAQSLEEIALRRGADPADKRSGRPGITGILSGTG